MAAKYLFAGSDDGEERTTALHSLIESAKLNGSDLIAWPRKLIARIPDRPILRVADLLPWNWTTRSYEGCETA